MGCQQSITVKETSEKSTITNSSRKPIVQARKKGIGATERLIGSYLEKVCVKEQDATWLLYPSVNWQCELWSLKKSGIELPPVPKVDENGHLMQEEVVKRTKSSVSVSHVVLGHVDKGTTVTASYAYWTQRGYYPDGTSPIVHHLYLIRHNQLISLSIFWQILTRRIKMSVQSPSNSPERRVMPCLLFMMVTEAMDMTAPDLPRRNSQRFWQNISDKKESKCIRTTWEHQACPWKAPTNQKPGPSWVYQIMKRPVKRVF